MPAATPRTATRSSFHGIGVIAAHGGAAPTVAPSCGFRVTLTACSWACLTAQVGAQRGAAAGNRMDTMGLRVPQLHIQVRGMHLMCDT